MRKSVDADDIVISVVTPQQWPGISQQFCDLSFEQTLTYTQPAASRVGATAQYLALHDAKGQLMAALSLRIKTIPLLGKGIAWAPAGPMVQRRDQPPTDADTITRILTALARYADTSGHILRLRFPILTPQLSDTLAHAAVTSGFDKTEHAHAYRSVIVDCTADEDTLMRDLHGKWRNLLRKAMKADTALEICPLADCHDRFDRMYREVQSEKGFQPDIPPDFYYQITGPDFQHDVHFARVDGEDVAGMTIGRTGSNAVYLFGATTHRGRALNAGYFLMWQTILACKDNGVRWLDLGGIDPVSNPEVTRFKQRTGGLDLTAPGPFEYRPRKPSTGLIRLAETAYSTLKGRR